MKQKNCKVCKEMFNPQRALQQACSMKCAIMLSQKIAKRDESKKWQAEKKVLKEKLKTISDWKKELQFEINKLVRIIDFGCPCIATGAFKGKMNAGHMISVGSNDTIRFHLHNIFIQSEHSNSYRAGDTIKYQEGIIKTFGHEQLDYMMSLRSIQPIKLTASDLKSAISKTRQIIKDIGEREYIYDSETRLKLRTLYNEQIGIYKNIGNITYTKIRNI